MGSKQGKLEKRYEQLVLQNANLVAQELQNRLSNKPCSLTQFTEQLKENSQEIAKLEELARQKNIQREVKYGQHFLKLVNFLLNFKKDWPISQKEEISSLLVESRNSNTLQNQVNELGKYDIKFFRRTLDDGNSFYRALGFAFLEHCVAQNEIRRLEALIQKLKNQQFACQVAEDTPQMREFLTNKLIKISKREIEFNDMYNVIDKPFILLLRSIAKNITEDHFQNNQMRFHKSQEAISIWGEEASDEAIYTYLAGALQIRLRIIDITKSNYKKFEIPINLFEQNWENEQEPCTLFLFARDVYNNKIRLPHFDVLYVNSSKLESITSIKLENKEQQKQEEEAKEKKEASNIPQNAVNQEVK